MNTPVKRKSESEIKSPIKQVAINFKEKLDQNIQQKGKVEIDLEKLSKIVEELSFSADDDSDAQTLALSRIFELLESKLERKPKKLAFSGLGPGLEKLGIKQRVTLNFEKTSKTSTPIQLDANNEFKYLNQRSENSIKTKIARILDKIIEEKQSKSLFIETELTMSGVIEVEKIPSKINGRLDIAVGASESDFENIQLFQNSLKLGNVFMSYKAISCIIEIKRQINSNSSIVQLLAELICLSSITGKPSNGILVVSFRLFFYIQGQFEAPIFSIRSKKA